MLTFWMFNESNIGTKVYHIWKRGQPNYGPSKLLLYFIDCRLDQLNKKHTKIAVNLTMQSFEASSQKKCLLKVWIFGSPTTKWRPCTIFAKLNGNHLLMANMSELHEYQTFGLMKMHNMRKIWVPNDKFNLLRWNKKYFSWFFKGFQFPEIISDPRLHL